MAEEVEPVVDIHISKDEFKQLLAQTREGGYINLTYNPDNALHTKIIDAALDAELIEEEPQADDEIEFTADFNIFLMNLDNLQNFGPAPDVAPEEQPGDPGAAGGRRRRKTRRRKTKKHLKK